jgi:hypothetical protein
MIPTETGDPGVGNGSFPLFWRCPRYVRLSPNSGGKAGVAVLLIWAQERSSPPALFLIGRTAITVFRVSNCVQTTPSKLYYFLKDPSVPLVALRSYTILYELPKKRRQSSKSPFTSLAAALMYRAGA